jgi:hypothetical protein
MKLTKEEKIDDILMKCIEKLESDAYNLGYQSGYIAASEIE